MHDLQTTASAEALTQRIASLTQAGHLSAARSLLAAVRRLVPPSPRLTELSARLSMREGRLDLALGELDEAVRQSPGHADLRKCRAELRLQMDDSESAAADAAEAVILDSHDPGQGAARHPDAGAEAPGRCRRLPREAVMADPSIPPTQGLAAAQEAR